jgi:hypothetical protein
MRSKRSDRNGPLHISAAKKKMVSGYSTAALWAQVLENADTMARADERTLSMDAMAILARFQRACLMELRDRAGGYDPRPQTLGNW